MYIAVFVRGFFFGGGVLVFSFLLVFVGLRFMLLLLGFFLNLRRHFWSSYEKNIIIF